MTDRLSGIVEAVRLRVEDELRQQLNALTKEHERALNEALREAAKASEQQAQETEARWSSRLAEARAQAEQTLASAVAAARAETLGTARADFEAERLNERSSAAALRIRLSQDLDRAATLGAVLDALAVAAATEAGGALFVVKRGSLERWSHRAAGPGPIPPELLEAASDAARTGASVRRGEVLAVPVLLDRTAVAVVAGVEPAGPHSALEQMAMAGAVRLTALTASRLVQAERWVGARPASETWRPTSPADFPSEGL